MAQGDEEEEILLCFRIFALVLGVTVITYGGLDSFPGSRVAGSLGLGLPVSFQSA